MNWTLAARMNPRTLRLSFVTLVPALIERAVAALGKVLREAADEAPAVAQAFA